MPLKDIGLALVVQVIWGVGFTLMKPAMAAFPPILFITLCYAIVALVLAPIAPRSRTSFGWMALITLLGGSGQSCLLAYGLSVLPASTSTLLLQLTVPFAVLLSWIARVDRPSLRNGLGCTVALIGVAIVIGAPDETQSWAGVVAIVIGSLTWAIAQILIRLHSKETGATFYGAMARHAAPQCLVFSLVLERDQVQAMAAASIGDWTGLVAIAILGFAGGYILWYRLLLRNRIDSLLPFQLLMPPLGVATGVLLLGESLYLALVAGGAVVLAGLAIIVWPQRAAKTG